MGDKFRVACGSLGLQVAGVIFWSQVSAVGFQVRVRVRALNLYLVPISRTRNLMAETRDLRMKSRFRFTREMQNRFGWQVAEIA